MTDAGTPTPPLDDAAALKGVSRGYLVSNLVHYIDVHGAAFTEEALLESARRHGYPDDVVEEARARSHAKAASAPTRQRARRWILAAYAVTFGLLTLGMLTSPYAGQYGAGFVGTIILAVTLGLALLLSTGWLGWQGRKAWADAGASLVVFLSLPIILLVTVAGLCVATGLPIPRSY